MKADFLLPELDAGKLGSDKFKYVLDSGFLDIIILVDWVHQTRCALGVI